MTPEEVVAHKAQEQFDEYEHEIAALRAMYDDLSQAAAALVRELLLGPCLDTGRKAQAFTDLQAALVARSGPRAPGTYRRADGGIDVVVGVSESASWVADTFPDEVEYLLGHAEPDTVTHNPKPDWTVTHPRTTSCPWCSEPTREHLPSCTGNDDRCALDCPCPCHAATSPAEGLLRALHEHEWECRSDGHTVEFEGCPECQHVAALAPEKPE